MTLVSFAIVLLLRLCVLPLACLRPFGHHTKQHVQLLMCPPSCQVRFQVISGIPFSRQLERPIPSQELVSTTLEEVARLNLLNYYVRIKLRVELFTRDVITKW